MTPLEAKVLEIIREVMKHETAYQNGEQFLEDYDKHATDSILALIEVELAALRVENEKEIRASKTLGATVRSRDAIIKSLKSELSLLRKERDAYRGSLEQWVRFFESQTLPVQPVYWEKKLAESQRILNAYPKKETS